MKKWILIAISVLIVGYVGYQWYHSKNATQAASAQVRTATVQKGKLEVKISGSGAVQPVTSTDIKSNENNKIIDEVLWSPGEEVKAGEELITYTDGSDPVTAPADGMITSFSVAAGDRVTQGQVVAHLTNYKDLQTVVQVDELDITKIQVGQAVNIKVNALPDQTFTGKVSAVANEGTSSNGVSTFDVTVHFDQIDNLKVGMSTEVSILTASKKDALYVPLDAVHTANGEKYVIVASNSSNGQSEQKTVKTGLANEDYVEITEGVSEGDILQLPQLATDSSSTTNTRGMMQGGFGAGMGGMGGMGGFNRSNGGGQWRSGGERSGN
ncbi:efflux RND transporter periplasmic adaptor subunit [Neobacillus citreus]|uniref:Efflux RND transporter periplasmic adaptor subunit n=1 Tax=Neobacillus citreus TaxID=2833578 RepID=A0A942YDR2_9BACI|nr:efflux RND transporter periplasmic adaptor subunit [Neobacillus citreus]MCH6269115.1 efflux RND transporter periplasmic adaptor subunit [Neobacillus citreus]